VPSRMRAEIAEQPEALRRTFEALLSQAGELEALGRATRQVLFIARGSSDNAAVYGQYLCSARAGRLASLASPSLATVYRADLDLRGVLAVAVSQSGATEEIVSTLEWARRCGARTIAVTNVAGSPLTEFADIPLITQAGEEFAVPATKTYTTQLAAMAVLAHALHRPGTSRVGADAVPGGVGGVDGGGVGPPGRGPGSGGVEAPGHGPGGGGVEAPRRGPGGGGVEADDLLGVPEAVGAMLGAADAAEGLAQRLVGVEALVVSGRGFAYSTALELALKLKETCYLTAVGLSYADLVHGPIAVVDRRTPALLVAAGNGPMLPEMTALARRIAGTGADVHGIGGDPEFAAACRSTLPGTSLPEHLAPFALVVPGQLLAEALARARGIDPDAPRGLDKVTQTDA
jgi:glutamine---fructose-6-phosphate transaminase (isomerizing)